MVGRAAQRCRGVRSSVVRSSLVVGAPTKARLSPKPYDGHARGASLRMLNGAPRTASVAEAGQSVCEEGDPSLEVSSNSPSPLTPVSLALFILRFLLLAPVAAVVFWGFLTLRQGECVCGNSLPRLARHPRRGRASGARQRTRRRWRGLVVRRAPHGGRRLCSPYRLGACRRQHIARRVSLHRWRLAQTAVLGDGIGPGADGRPGVAGSASPRHLSLGDILGGKSETGSGSRMGGSLVRDRPLPALFCVVAQQRCFGFGGGRACCFVY